MCKVIINKYLIAKKFLCVLNNTPFTLDTLIMLFVEVHLCFYFRSVCQNIGYMILL